MTAAQYDRQWTCASCGNTYVVPSLARHCETKHETEKEGTQ